MEKIQESPASDFIRFQVNRQIITLFKNCLIILEDLKLDHPDISDEDFKRSRKKILDYGNSTLREMEAYLDKVEITFKV